MIICPWKDLKRYANVIPGLEEAIEAVNNLTSAEPGKYPLSGGNRFMVQQVTKKPWEGAPMEAHRQYLDVQYMYKGSEVMGWAPVDSVTPREAFNEEKDAGIFLGENTPIKVNEGYCYVVFPEDAHAPGLYIDEPGELTKIVIKLKV